MKPLGKNVFEHLAVDVCQAVVAALEFVGEPFVVDPEAVHDSCVQIVDVHRVLDDVVAEVVGFAVVIPGLMPPPAIQIE